MKTGIRGISAALLAAFLCASAAFADEAAKPAAEAKVGQATAEAPVVKKRPPRKELEYKQWAKAVEVAKAWEQPIVVFIELNGDKASAKLKSATFSKQEITKDLLSKYAVYYHCIVPQEKKKSFGNNQRAGKTGKPDYAAVKKSEVDNVTRLVGEDLLPFIGICKPDGSVLVEGNLAPNSDSMTPLADVLGELKDAFAKLKVELPQISKLERLVKAEKKKADDYAKTHKEE